MIESVPDDNIEIFCPSGEKNLICIKFQDFVYKRKAKSSKNIKIMGMGMIKK